MREKFIHFMQGRYGVDQLSKIMLGAGLILLVISSFVPYKIIYVIALILIFYSYFRTFSKNFSKRNKENQWFLKYYNRFIYFLRNKKKQNKTITHHIYTCPSCKQKIRIPKGKGKIQIRCPKCGKEFVKKS